jgi:hypothetical protein
MESLNMRTLFTALAFLVILLAVVPAVNRSLLARSQPRRGSARRQRLKRTTGGGHINAEG